MTMRYERYDAAGGAEWMLAFGPTGGAQVLIVPPLFEELNFTRGMIVAMARDLADRGIGAWIADLPGMGESVRSLDGIAWSDLRSAVPAAARAVAALAGTAPHVAALRGGALLDDMAEAPSHWRFAAADGAALLRQMERAQAIGDRESGRPAADPAARFVDLIGYRLARPMRDALHAARPAALVGPLREIPFAGPGAAPWRRAEPAPDAALSAALAEDIAIWIAACAG